MQIIDYVGHLDISPVLSDEEIEALARLRRSRPRGSSAPEGRSPWTTCPDGCCLTATGRATSGSGAGWLRHLLRTALLAHDLSGKVVGCARDDRELFVLSVSGSRVQSRVLSSATRRRTPDLADNVIQLASRRRS